MSELYHYISVKEKTLLNYTLTNIKDLKDIHNLKNCDPENSFVLGFDSPMMTGININDRVYCELYLCSSRKAPVILLLHGFGSKPEKLSNYYFFIDKMLANGFNCAFMHMPFHLDRTPPGEKSGERLLYFDDLETLEFYNQSVLDLRKLINIIELEFALFDFMMAGFSLGSMVSVIAMSFEKRIQKGVLLLGGGNWHEIHWNSFLAYLLKGSCADEGKMTKGKCRDFYKDYPCFLEEFKGIKDIEKIDSTFSRYPELKEKTSKLCFLCDPLTFASRIKPDRVLMINSKVDHYFTKRSTKMLWEELGKPDIYWVNRLHTSKILSNRHILKIVLGFFRIAEKGSSH